MKHTNDILSVIKTALTNKWTNVVNQHCVLNHDETGYWLESHSGGNIGCKKCNPALVVWSEVSREYHVETIVLRRQIEGAIISQDLPGADDIINRLAEITSEKERVRRERIAKLVG
jgi:hypothetical protein